MKSNSKPNNMKLNLKSMLLCIVALFMATVAMADNDNKQLPVDKNVRIGKLKNGLTYYIRHNETPKNLVNFYIAQKVGSELANIPIVAMTANAFAEDRKQAFEVGMNGHVAKPIDVANLLEVLGDIISK